MEDSLTVFVPCYNRKKYIIRCLQSIKSQHYPYKYIVVVDDGSTDGTFQLLDEIKKDWGFFLLRTDQPRRTSCWISNMVMETFDSNYYQVVDSDDILLPGATRKMVKFMMTEKADIVGGQYIFINAQGRRFSKVYHWRPYDANYAYKMRRDQHVSRSGMIWKKKVIDKVGRFNGSWIGVADYEFALRCLEKGIRIRNVPFIIAKVRIHKGSVTTTHFFGKANKRLIRDRARLNKKYPLYFHCEYKYLDFFKKELHRLLPYHNKRLEDQIFKYVYQLIREEKINNSRGVIHLIKKTSDEDYRRNYLLTLLFIIDKDRERAKKYFANLLKQFRFIPHTECYYLASFCEKNNFLYYACMMFEHLLGRPNLTHEMRGGIWFHRGCIFQKMELFNRAEKCYKRCLTIQKDHKASKKALKEIQKT